MTETQSLSGISPASLNRATTILLLRHLPAHHRPLRARARRAALGAGDPQDDRRDGARAQAQGPRPARQGYRADVAIFDPVDFRDRATYADPHQFPTGARTHVIVNGVLVVENAAHTGALPGHVLRRDSAGAVS